MTTWYRKQRWSDKIEEVEVVKVSEFSIWYLSRAYPDSTPEKIMVRRTAGEWFETRLDCLTYMFEQAREAVLAARRDVERAEAKLVKAREALDRG